MIEAEPCKAWKDFKGYKAGDEGYKLYYPNGDISWCPKNIFEAQHLEIENENTISQSDIDNFIVKTNLIETKEDEDACFRLLATCKNNFITDGNTRFLVGYKNITEEKIEYMKERVLEDIKKEIKKYLYFLLQCANNGFKGDSKMKLQDTINLMLSDDFKERFQAEYAQDKNRTEGLEKMLEALKAGTLPFKPKCSYELLHEQLVYMQAKLKVLKERAKIEQIDLSGL